MDGRIFESLGKLYIALIMGLIILGLSCIGSGWYIYHLKTYKPPVTHNMCIQEVMFRVEDSTPGKMIGEVVTDSHNKAVPCQEVKK